MDMARKQSGLPIVAAASCMGAPDRRCVLGPEAVLKAMLQADPALQPHIVRPPQDDGQEALQFFVDQLAGEVAGQMAESERIAVLSGDHSCAIGTWRGVARTLDGPLGLIWIDAHMDAHTTETSPSGQWHGMPVAALLGKGGLGGGAATVRPEHMCLIGVRSFEPDEQALLERLGVRVILMEEVRRIGFEAAMAEAVAIASTGTAGYGLSIDLDGLDPSDAPGVGSPVVGGVRGADLLAALTDLQADPHFKALEVAEYNPVIDVEQRTLQLVLQIINQISGAEHESDH
jgi:arginase